ncbi:substrate-binding periplasmic protein [Halodesulfovibrio marinisediminis]|uniref:ABC-type amino acid transport substrate-binding protein n=1 Tax=Halodesulfovibrio marinisediminis DSM 17456 TaxID=1121457 RepID=A0A1N6IDU7_9BACT|nr:transporter substrate-binding domain-containing protein [Halodesulfovibrio marinisediminis]SIO30105.1 ABC-type amino acid transport substrate-binding protein [Halodesulfovibrio marinisediminis DSM 17456]
MKRFLLCLVMVLCGCLDIGSAKAESLIVGVMSADRPPYFWKDDSGGYRGLYIDLLNELTKETSIHFSYKALPMARIRLYMVAEKIDVEVGVAKRWRKEKAEVENSVYSIPFMKTELVFVMHSMPGNLGITRSTPADGMFCSILGFSVPKMAGEKDRQYVLSERQLLKMIDKKRCDYTVMQYNIFSHLMRENSYDLVASSSFKTYDVRLRLNKKHEWLLPRINEGLRRMKLNGRLASILKRYR